MPSSRALEAQADRAWDPEIYLLVQRTNSTHILKIIRSALAELVYLCWILTPYPLALLGLWMTALLAYMNRQPKINLVIIALQR